MLRYLPGIVLVQLVTLALFWVNRSGTGEEMLLRAGLPALFIACVTALWLSTIGRMEAERRQSKLKEEHSSERERLNREIERVRTDSLQQASVDKAQVVERAHSERERLVKQTHKEIIKQERRVSRHANVKVGLAFMAMTGAGVILLVTELLTLGLLTITTAGGAMGGYLLRWRQTRRVMNLVAQTSRGGDTVDAVFEPIVEHDEAPDSSTDYSQLSAGDARTDKSTKIIEKGRGSQTVS